MLPSTPATSPGKSFFASRRAVIALLAGIPLAHLILQRNSPIEFGSIDFLPLLSWGLVSLLAGVRSLISARRAETRQARVAWVLLAVGALLWMAGIVYESVGSLLAADFVFGGSVSRFLYLAYPVAMLAGVYILTSGGPRSLGAIHLANLGAIGSATLVCTLLILLEPVIRSSNETSYIVYSITDLTVLLTAAIVALTFLWSKETTRLRPAIALLFLSASVHAAANIGFYYRVFEVGTSGTSLDVYWLVAFLLHYWAAHEHDKAQDPLVESAPQARWLTDFAGFAQVTLPAVLLLGILILLLFFSANVSQAFIIAAMPPAVAFAFFLALRDWAIERHRQRLMDDLHDSYTLNAQVLKASPGLIFICAATPGFPISYISENGKALFGIDIDNFDFFHHVHPDDRRAVSSALQQTIASGAASTEFRLRNEDGSWLWVDQLTVLKHDAAGNPTEIVGTILDIHERKSLQDSMQQAQRLESLGRLSGSVAHDFNNLLTSILGFSTLLSESDKLAPEERDYAEEIKAAGERGAALTRQLLSFSRRHAFSMDVIDVNELLAQMRGMLERLLGDSVDLEFQPSRLPLRVKGSANQLEQVLMNLVLNARDAMPQGGSIGISAQEICETGNGSKGDGGRLACISVQDEGTGMSPVVKAQIFDPFFTTKADGTGLGLATAHGIVRQHGGRIEVTSELGHGTRFDVYLPSTTEPVSTDAAPTESYPRQGDEIILVVDDEVAITRVVASILAPLGYSIHTANNAEDALKIAMQQDFDLLLTDIIMPGCNGRELSRRLEAVRPGFEVIYMSGYTGDILARGYVSDGDIPLLQKPLVVDELVACIRQRLDAVRSAPAAGGKQSATGRN